MLAIEVVLRRLRNKELRTVRIRATVGHRNHASFVLQRTDFIVNGIAGATLAIAFGVAALDHEPRNHAMEREAIVKALICKFHEIGNGIGSRLEVQRKHNLAFVGFDDSFNSLYTSIILVINLSLCKSKHSLYYQRKDKKWNW